MSNFVLGSFLVYIMVTEKKLKECCYERRKEKMQRNIGEKKNVRMHPRACKE
jgi:hypothetical protein